MDGFQQMFAHVAAGSPADEAGIRNGGDATKLPTQQSDLKFPAGTKLALTLKRGDKEFAVTVTLRDILGPSAATGATKTSKR